PALAGAGTAPDVEVEAHLALLEDVVRAGPEGQELAQALDGAAQALRAGVGAEVERAVVEDAAGVVDPRELLGDRQLEVEVVLVVLEPDVEAGPVVLDQVGLQDQRLRSEERRGGKEVRS